MRPTLLAIICTGPCWGPWAYGQDPRAEAEKPVLRGPRLAPQTTHATMVEIEFPGKVRRPETSPEERAAALLDLDPAARAVVDAVLYRRAKVLDEFVADNLELIVKLVTAGASGNKLDQAVLAGEALQKLAPLDAKGTLRTQIEGVLPAEKKSEFDRLLKEYWDAVVAEQQRSARPDEPAPAEDKKPAPARQRTKARWEIILQERAESFGREVERAFKRQESAGAILFKYLTSGIELSREQADRVRAVCEAFAAETRMDASPEQQQKFFFDLGALLDTKQQTLLIRRLQGK